MPQHCLTTKKRPTRSDANRFTQLNLVITLVYNSRNAIGKKINRLNHCTKKQLKFEVFV